MIITSRSNPKVREFIEARDGKAPGRFAVEGYHLVEMALSSGLAERIYSVKPFNGDVGSYEVSEDVMRKMAFSKNPEGIAAICRKKEQRPISSKRVLVLDGVSDPGNVGTLIRGASAFSFFDVILLNHCASPFSPRAVSASQGGIFLVNLIEGLSPEEAVAALRKQGYIIMGTDLKSSKPLEETDVPEDKGLALILGNEARGVSAGLLSQSDVNVRISMSKDIDSLNVAMAGSIIMHRYRL